MESDINNIQDALESMGVNDSLLSPEEKQSLDVGGFAVLRNVLDTDQIHEVLEVYEALMNKEGQAAGGEFHQEKGARRLADLVNKGKVFDIVYTCPKVLATMFRVIGREFKLSSLNGRDALPGEGSQNFHADWGTLKEGEPFHVANSIWLLDDFQVDNGSTRVVPGSHLWYKRPSEVMENPADDYPGQELVIAPAGSVIVINAHIWHGGTLNRTNSTRRVLHGYFTAREHLQQMNQQEHLRKTTYDRISPAARYILDV